MLEVVGDIEANDLLNHNSIDYLSSPYKLKENFVIHCASFIDINTDEEYDFDPTNIHLLPEFLSKCDRLIFHNGINYDYLAIKLFFGLDYEINEEVGQKDIWNGKEIELDDTLVLSKVLNPDRFGGHSIEAFGKRFKEEKIDWRKRAEELGLCEHSDPKGAEFKIYHPEMLIYCKKDTRIGLRVYRYLKEEWGDWAWDEAYKLEKKVSDIITRQEHRGFYFYKNRAEAAVKDLDAKMAEIEEKVLPLIPAKAPTQALLKEMKFPAKPFKKDGSVSAAMEKWIEKHKAVPLWGEPNNLIGVEWLNKTWYAPFPAEPVITEVPATLKDSTHIKEWLVGLGWEPSSFKERDLTVDQKKVKISKEKFIKVVDKYVEQTLNSNFCKHRCEHLKVDSEDLKAKLLSHDLSKPLKVLTNPSFTVGQEKDIDPRLEKLHAKFPYAIDVVHWLTYSHRRNSILGGGLDWEYGEEAEKGYLAQERINIDNRIPTPADTCGASTSRMKHRITVNVPRTTSLYGSEMRSLFGVEPKEYYQIGYDFAGLEARIEAAYTYKYPGGKEYAKLLISEKPNDLHTLNAKYLNVSRDVAKTIKYALTYGSQPASLAKNMGWTLKRAKKVYNEFWNNAKPLKALRDRLEQYWESTGKKFIKGLDSRKVPVRSKHALLNTLFQSAGVICAKRAMIIHERKLRVKGLTVDFFKEDWKHKDYIQQLIAYHDEAQLELKKALAQIKTFKTEEAANDWKYSYENRTKRILSNVKHKGNIYYVAYSEAGETAVQSAREAGQYYNLDIDLDADYDLAQSWEGTH